jgi:hypothetical protein
MIRTGGPNNRTLTDEFLTFGAGASISLAIVGLKPVAGTVSNPINSYRLVVHDTEENAIDGVMF